MQNNQRIDDYYELSLLCEDDIKIVALLVQMESLELNKKILTDLETLKLDKYNFDRILTNLNVKTIKNLKCFLGINANNYDNKKLIRIVTKETNLLDLIVNEE